MTLLNYWHYIAFGIIFIFFVLGIISAFKQEKRKLVLPMILSVTLVTSLLAVFSTVVVDKYTKKVELSGLDSKRLLSIEKVAYFGSVKNVGNHKIGEVTLEIKLVNKGHATGNVKGGSFFKSSGFFDFFSGGADMLYKPQTVTKEFVVAKNLKPGTAKSFRVYFDFPPYFRSVSHFATVSGR